MPGIGVLSAIVLLSALGDGSRFPSLVGYSRQCTSVGGSGATHRIGKITKEGPRDVRTTMVEAAWVAVETTAQLEDRVRRWGVKFRPALTLTTAAIADEPRRR
jgi:transposase